jgi:hypothetical protein
VREGHHWLNNYERRGIVQSLKEKEGKTRSPGLADDGRGGVLPVDIVAEIGAQEYHVVGVHE